MNQINCAKYERSNILNIRYFGCLIPIALGQRVNLRIFQIVFVMALTNNA